MTGKVIFRRFFCDVNMTSFSRLAPGGEFFFSSNMGHNIPLERKFNADQKSLWDHHPEIMLKRDKKALIDVSFSEFFTEEIM